ncbi:MAG: GreA/GreB family elongation factor [Candidatus Aegiribacteria sp.]|nr:GreA/GreB family elongation factor [Candidatus Aegiribacteria sp.]
MSKILDTASVGDYDALTDLWLEILDGDVSYDEMIGVFSILLNNGEDDLATELLELTIDEKETENEDAFSGFLVKAADFFRKSEPLRKSLIEVIRDNNLMFQPLEQFLKLSGLKKENADVQSSWRVFNSLMKYRKGGYLYHGTFGVGQITRMSRSHATIDFQKAQNHDMKLNVVLESTRPLASSSLAVLSWKNLEEFSRLFRECPSKFLERLSVESLENPGEICIQDLPAFFSGSEFTEGEAWKILRKTAASTEGFADLGARIVLLDEKVEFLERVKKIINRRREPAREKVREVQALLKSCCSAFPDGLTDLLDDVRSISSPETGSMFELCWILSDRGKEEEFSDIKHDLMESTAARGERALGEILSSACRKDYLDLFFSAQTERVEKVRLLSGLRRSLWEHAAAFLEEFDPELLSECIGDYLSKPSETDRFLWTLTFLASRGDKLDDNLADNQTGLFLDNLIFSSADTQKKVIHLLTGPLKSKLNSYLSSIDTRKLSNYLDSFNSSATALNEGLCLIVGREISRRKSSSIGKSVKKRFWESDALFSSLGAIEQRESDALRLKQTEIPAAAEAIGEAASHGDLSENAEYAAAIEKRDLLLDRLNRWMKELQMYRVYPPDEITSDTVSPGIRVQLQESGGAETVQTIDVVGPLDADPENGRINYMAPLGKALLGKSIGDMVVLPGDDSREWRVTRLERLDLVKR